MNLTFEPEDEAFRQEVREWLEANKPREPRPERGAEMRAFDLAWQRKQYDGGWAGLSWPVEHGGRGLSLLRQLIWHEEYARADAPPIGSLFVAMNHGGPTIIARGSEEQKEFHLPRILRGEAVWCQGFSEPGAGSDLAAVSTRATIDGDHLVVSGQKVWTSYGHVADFQELLIRTSTGAKKHHGLTWVICPMNLPGITVRPITIISGSQHFCEIFYDDVRIPISNVVGEIGGGWDVAMTTLSFERGTGLVGWQIELATKVEELISLTADRRARRDVAEQQEVAGISYRLATAKAEVLALRSMTYALISRASRGSVGSEGTMVGLYFAELAKRVYALSLDVLGADSIERDGSYGDWTTLYLESFRHAIAGGTSQIRRNIIGERVLGLPREG